MNTKLVLGSFAILLGSLFVACNKHEVVPPPADIVDLEVHFTGNVNGTYVEYTDDVDGFNGETSEAQYVLTSPQLSTVSYYCNMTSNLINRSLKVGLGSIYWDAGAIEKPLVEDFNSFFTSKKDVTTIPYTTGAVDGFEVIYTDNFNNVWTSSETSVNPQSVLFTAIENDSDNTGDYSKFTVEFSCYLYRTVTLNPLVIDSIRIDNGVLDGWFKR
ncbi:MAG: hypothetical protein ACK5B9_03925 [Flavobacteriia bacterium]